MNLSELNPNLPGMLGAYAAALEAKGFEPDPAQMLAVERLETLYQALVSFNTALIPFENLNKGKSSPW